MDARFHRRVQADLNEILAKYRAVSDELEDAMADLLLVEQAGRGAVDVTVGSALDLFGGKGLRYKDLVAWNRRSSSQ